MRKVFSVVALLCLLTLSVWATDVTVQTAQIKNWVGPKTNVELWLFLSEPMVTPEGETFPGSSPSKAIAVVKVACTVTQVAQFGVTSYTLTVPQFTLPATRNAARGRQAHYTAWFYSAPPNKTATKITDYQGFTTFFVEPQPSTQTWSTIALYNQPIIPYPWDNGTFTRQEILALLGRRVNDQGALNTFLLATEYGAICNGIADDTIALNNARDAARAAGKTLLMPAGMCQTLQFPFGDNDHVQGAGMEKTFIRGLANQPIVTVPTTAFNASLRDFTIVGSTSLNNQIGLNLGGNADYSGLQVHRVYVKDTGSHGLFLRRQPFSPDFNSIHVSNTVGYPILVDSPIAPNIVFRNTYVHVIHPSSPLVGYRIKRGRVRFENANGLDNAPSIAGTRWAVLGMRPGLGGADAGDTESGSAYVEWVKTNFEAYESVAIDHYYFSYSSFKDVTWAYVNSPAGNNPNRIGLRYEINEALGLAYAAYMPRGTIDTISVIGQPESDYKNGSFIHSNNVPPLQLEGQGASIAPPDFPLGFYYDTEQTRRYPLFRSDGQAARITVTGNISLNRPTIRYIEVNCPTACTVQIPWAGWYRRTDSLVVKDISGNAATNRITITTQASGTIDGQSYIDIGRNRGAVTLRPYESNTVTGVDWRVENEYAGGVPATVPTNGASNIDYFPRWETSTGRLSLSSNLFQFGSDLFTAGKFSFQRGANFLNLDASPAATYTWKFPTSAPAGARCLEMDATGQVYYAASACGIGGGGGSFTLNTQTGSTQTLSKVDDTNVTLTITSAANNHAFQLGFTGTLAKARQNSATVYTDQGNTFSTGAQSFAAASSLLLPLSAGASPTASASVAYDTTSNTLEAGINGVNKTFLFTDGNGSALTALNGSNIATGTVSVARGGTGLTSAINNSVMVGDGSIWGASVIPDCSNATTSKLLYNNTTRVFSCGSDQTGAGGSGITTFNLQTGSTQTLSKVDDTNVTLTITSSSNNHAFQLGFTGTLAKARQNSATAYTDQANTFGAFVQTFQGGANHVITDTTDLTKRFQFDVSNIATATTRTVNIPNANSTTVQADTGAANQFLTAISAQGVVSMAQPSFANLSGAATSGQLPSTAVNAVTNDTNITGSISAQTLTLGFTGTLAKARQNAATVYTDQANSYGAFVQTFRAGGNFLLADSTDTTKRAQFDVSNIATATTRTVNIPNANSTTVQADTGAANQFLTAISAQGVISKAQPSFSNLSGTATSGQLPATLVYNSLSNTYSSGDQDFGLADSFTVPKFSSYTPTTDGRVGFDTSDFVYRGSQGASTRTFVTTTNSLGQILNANVATGAAIALNKLAATTASRALVSDGSGFMLASSVTATQLGYLGTATSDIQTQLNGKQATGNYLTGLSGDVTATGPGSPTATIANAAVTLPKMAWLAANNVLGRITAGTGQVEVLTGSNLRTITGLATTDAPSFVGLTLNPTGAGSNGIIINHATGAYFAAIAANSPNGVVIASYAGLGGVEYRFRDNNAGTDAKNWRYIVGGNNFEFSIVNDAYLAASSVFSVTRSGNTPTAFTIAPAVTLSNLAGTGTRVMQASSTGVVSATVAVPTAVRLASDFSKTSDITIQDTALVLNVEAGKTYSIYADLFTTSSSSGGVKFMLGGTATATAVIASAYMFQGSSTGVGTQKVTALGVVFGDQTSVSTADVMIRGSIVVNAAGTLVIRFAQNASNGTASVLKAGSTFGFIQIQ